MCEALGACYGVMQFADDTTRSNLVCTACWNDRRPQLQIHTMYPTPKMTYGRSSMCHRVEGQPRTSQRANHRGNSSSRSLAQSPSHGIPAWSVYQDVGGQLCRMYPSRVHFCHDGKYLTHEHCYIMSGNASRRCGKYPKGEL